MMVNFLKAILGLALLVGLSYPLHLNWVGSCHDLQSRDGHDPNISDSTADATWSELKGMH